jgi:hypothetical protein
MMAMRSGDEGTSSMIIFYLVKLASSATSCALGCERRVLATVIYN